MSMTTTTCGKTKTGSPALAILLAVGACVTAAPRETRVDEASQGIQVPCDPVENPSCGVSPGGGGGGGASCGGGCLRDRDCGALCRCGFDALCEALPPLADDGDRDDDFQDCNPLTCGGGGGGGGTGSASCAAVHCTLSAQCQGNSACRSTSTCVPYADGDGDGQCSW